jgi:toxin ParE1/3/4
MAVRFREAALLDLEQIFEFSFARFGVQTAQAYRDGLQHVFALLDRNPGIGPANEILGRGIRSFAFKSHRIYYEIANGDVIVARILHKAQDVADKLDP